MTLFAEGPSREASQAVPPRLSADLLKLRDRFLLEYPQEAQRVDHLAQVPAALRHLLGLRLDLDRGDALPRHYRDLAAAVLDAGAPADVTTDAVERLVIAYAAAVKAGQFGDAGGLLPRLRRYFTEPQIIELVLTLSLARAFAGFDAMLGVQP